MNGRGGTGGQGPTEPLLKRPRVQIRLWYWLLLLGLVVLINVLFGVCSSSQRPSIPYSTFVAQIQADNVSSATFQGSQITGDFKKAVSGQTTYSTQEPSQGDPDLGVGQTRVRLYSEERPRVTFADVASNHEAKQDLLSARLVVRRSARVLAGDGVPRGGRADARRARRHSLRAARGSP